MWGLNWRSRIGWSKHPHTFFLLIIATILYLASLFFWVTRVTGNLEERVEVPFEKDLSEVVDDYCRNLDQRFYTETNPESESTLTRAKRAKLIRDSLIFFPDLGQMWCLVPKAASTSWSRILLQRLSKNDSVRQQFLNKLDNDTKPVQVILKELFGHINKMLYIDAVRNEDVKKVLLVRHPFARIASAYRDKLRNRKAHLDGAYFYQHYGAQIIRKYRKDRRIKQLEPTFPEFVDFLIDNDPIDYDEHWQPISLLCGLCHVKYNTVLKTESLGSKSYVQGMLRTLGFSGLGDLTWENTSDDPNHLGVHVGNESWISDYYKTIPRSKMVLLYKKYEMDFHVFNYSFLQYYFP